MPLDLQLHRIQKLLKLLKNPHHGPHFIHVAGTNGKGSVCSYISHILTEAGIKNGRFNSPHLVIPRDSIQINNIPVSISLYEKCKAYINETNEKHKVGCTEFELLTCVAFQVFAETETPIAIMEVGVGGRMDATNVIPAERTLVVGITKVALDHQNLLGKTLAQIGYQKVGIFKEKVPAVIDGTNDDSVLQVARNEARELQCSLTVTDPSSDCYIKPALLGDYQYDNLAVALKMIDVLKCKGYNTLTEESIENGVKATVWPGRLQMYNFDVQKIGLDDTQSVPILLDGAHNSQAAVELGKYLSSIRNKNGFIFVIAITKGKELSELFKPIIIGSDMVIFTQFNEGIEGMPWIEPTSVDILKEQISAEEIDCKEVLTIPRVEDAIMEAILESRKSGRQIVVCGSLYLVADILRL